jgi:hypothetical protein
MGYDEVEVDEVEVTVRVRTARSWASIIGPSLSLREDAKEGAGEYGASVTGEWVGLLLL